MSVQVRLLGSISGVRQTKIDAVIKAYLDLLAPSADVTDKDVPPSPEEIERKILAEVDRLNSGT